MHRPLFWTILCRLGALALVTNEAAARSLPRLKVNAGQRRMCQ